MKNESEQTAFRCPVWSAGGAMCAFSNHQSLCTGTDSYMVHHHESYVGLTGPGGGGVSSPVLHLLQAYGEFK